MTYEGKVYQVASDQWSWSITEDGTPIQGAGGYDSEDDAYEDMYSAFSDYEERSV